MYFNRQTRLSLVHREISSPTTDYIAAAAAATAAAALLPNDLYLYLRRMYKYHFVSECFDTDFIVDDMDRKFFKVLFSPVHSLHSLLPPVKSNPHGLRSRDHNLQLPVCNSFSRKSFIIRSLFRFK